MRQIVFVIGGCRSGKSREALKVAESFGLQEEIFIATCVPHDAEMKKRIERHRAERDKHWQTLEIPTALAEAVRSRSSPATVLLIDCLTLWTANLMMDSAAGGPAPIESRVHGLLQALNGSRGPVVLVSNEVGSGIVPENDMARRFRDAAGTVNQAVARAADKVIWMVAGIPVIIKA